jgi:hypothetical protein
MNLLLVRLRSPKIMGSLLQAASFVARKVESPPRRLLRIAASVPSNWGKHLIDLQDEGPEPEALEWTDCAILDNSFVGSKLFSTTVHALERNAVTVCSASGGDGTARSERSLGEVRLPLRIQPMPSWKLANLSQYTSVSIPLHARPEQELTMHGEIRGPSVEEMRPPEEIVEELNHLYVAGWRKQIHLFTSADAVSDSAWLSRVFAQLERWRFGKRIAGFSADVCTRDIAEPQLASKAARAGIADAFVRFNLQGEQSLGLKSENDCICFLKKLQRLGIQVRGGLPMIRAGISWEETMEEAARLRSLRLDRLLAQLVGAPLAFKNRVHALRTVRYLGKSFHDVRQIVTDVAHARKRTPQVLTLAAAIAIYSDAYRLVEQAV